MPVVLLHYRLYAHKATRWTPPLGTAPERRHATPAARSPPRMNRPTATRREIAPLHVPWLQHEQFPATKQACSTDDGLVTSGKHSLIKVIQELKRGRANVDKQLAQLDSQLLAITDYLDGKSANMFPPHLITYVEDTQGVTSAQSTAGVDGRRHGAVGAAAVAGKFNDIVKNESTPPTAAMVEDDLNSDTPCTSIGLWKYLYAYSFFKTITPEDMEQSLLLEDPNAYSEEIDSSEGGLDKVIAGLDFKRLQDKFSLSKSSPQDLDDFFKERLVASLCPVDTSSSSKEDDAANSLVDSAQPDDEDKHDSGSTKSLVDQASWKPKGLTRVLRDIGLLEGSEEEIAQLGVASPRDDEISQEIRTLQLQLRTCVEETNEAKRKLRKIMDETKPWLSQKKENEDATIKKYFTMWQTKKELARKKKLRDKKLQRRQALRLGGGGGNGKPLPDGIAVKQR